MKQITLTQKEAEEVLTIKKYSSGNITKVYGCIDQNNNFLGYLSASDFSKFWLEEKVLGIFDTKDEMEQEIVGEILGEIKETLKANWIVCNAYLEEVKPFFVEVIFPMVVEKKHKYSVLFPHTSVSGIKYPTDECWFKLSTTDMTFTESLLFLKWLVEKKQLNAIRKITHAKSMSFFYFDFLFPFQVDSLQQMEGLVDELLENFQKTIV